MLALQVGGELVVCILYLWPALSGLGPDSRLILTTTDGITVDPLESIHSPTY